MTSILKSPLDKDYYDVINATQGKVLKWQPVLTFEKHKVKLQFQNHCIIYIGGVVYFDGEPLKPKVIKTYQEFYRVDPNRKHQPVLMKPDGGHVIKIDAGDDGKLFVKYYSKEALNRFRGCYEHIWAFFEGCVWCDELGKGQEVWKQ